MFFVLFIDHKTCRLSEFYSEGPPLSGSLLFWLHDSAERQSVRKFFHPAGGEEEEPLFVSTFRLNSADRPGNRTRGAAGTSALRRRQQQLLRGPPSHGESAGVRPSSEPPGRAGGLLLPAADCGGGAGAAGLSAGQMRPSSDKLTAPLRHVRFTALSQQEPRPAEKYTRGAPDLLRDFRL